MPLHPFDNAGPRSQLSTKKKNGRRHRRRVGEPQNNFSRRRAVNSSDKTMNMNFHTTIVYFRHATPPRRKRRATKWGNREKLYDKKGCGSGTKVEQVVGKRRLWQNIYTDCKYYILCYKNRTNDKKMWGRKPKNQHVLVSIKYIIMLLTIRSREKVELQDS